MTYVYRNKNTGDVVTDTEPRMRLERLANWERLAGEDPAERAKAKAEAEAAVTAEYEALVAKAKAEAAAEAAKAKAEAEAVVPDPVPVLVDGEVPAAPDASTEEDQAPAADVPAEPVADEPKPVAKKAASRKGKAGGE